MAELIFNQDSNSFFWTTPAEKVSGEAVDACIDRIADAGADTIMINTNGMKTSYRSEVWESDWDGYDPDGPDDQPFFRQVLPDQARRFRPMLDSQIALYKQGIDYPERMLARSRERGASAWVSLRVNDVHYTVPEPDHPNFSTFWREHPTWRRAPRRLGGRHWQALDWGRSEVRGHHMKLVVETFERYDIDGLEIDWMRYPFNFRLGREIEGGRLLNQWMREVRDQAEMAGARRGHPVRIGVRVPSDPETARRLGLDVVTWAREGWVNLVVLSPDAFGGVTEYDMPVRLWKQLLSPCGARLGASLLPAKHRYVGAPMERPEPADSVGAATAMLYGGADAIALFNFFPEQMASWCGWSRDDFTTTLKAMRSLDTLAKLPRRHLVTYRQITAPGELMSRNPHVEAAKNQASELGPGEFYLPAQGEHLAFRLQTGPRPTGRKVSLVIGIEDGADGDSPAPAVLVNDVSCPPRETSRGRGTFTYDVSEDALSDEEHVIEVMANLLSGPTVVKVTRVEFHIG